MIDCYGHWMFGIELGTVKIIGKVVSALCILIAFIELLCGKPEIDIKHLGGLGAEGKRMT